MFKRILVANRGEIALRIMRTCREMGIETVAVYSDVDRSALHVRYADQAYLLGPGVPRESYLSDERVLEAARRSGAEAIHPGYGFLSENAAFAEACAGAGIAFVGPTAETMRLLGDKVAARRLAVEAGVPVVPGENHILQPEDGLAAAENVGYPVLIKAVSGGGGKGIRLVRSGQELEAALRVAGSEAASAFGDHNLYIEKFLEPVRHIEVQFLADNQGRVLTFGERECSIQRRHQKLIEESPSTAVCPELRARMSEATVAVARAARYQNAGTVEFLLDEDGEFYFLEVNTRLQVEHPVTELVARIDLVREQLRVAANEPLIQRQEDVRLEGWAIECRIAAEDPLNDFLPSLGRIDYVSEPSGPGVRVDSSLYAGGDVPYHYDPMLAKVIVWGRERSEAINRMRRALREFTIVGVKSNIPFHLQMLGDESFLQGRLHTRLLDDETRPVTLEARDGEEVALLTAALLAHRKRAQNGTEVSLISDGNGWKASGRLSGLRAGSRVRGNRWL